MQVISVLRDEKSELNPNCANSKSTYFVKTETRIVRFLFLLTIVKIVNMLAINRKWRLYIYIYLYTVCNR